MKRRLLIFVLVALGASIVVVDAQFSRDFTEEFLQSPTGRALLQSYGTIKSNYLEDVDDQELSRGAINGMLRPLEGPYYSHQSPDAATRDAADPPRQHAGLRRVRPRPHQ